MDLIYWKRDTTYWRKTTWRKTRQDGCGYLRSTAHICHHGNRQTKWRCVLRHRRKIGEQADTG